MSAGGLSARPTRAIVDGHGGSIALADNDGPGTSFNIRIPSNLRRTADTPAHSAPHSRTTLLVEEARRDFLLRLLSVALVCSTPGRGRRCLGSAEDGRHHPAPGRSGDHR